MTHTLDPEYAVRVSERFPGRSFSAGIDLGVQLIDVQPRATEARAEQREELTRQHGYFHAGVSAALVESLVKHGERCPRPRSVTPSNQSEYSRVQAAL